MIPGPLPLSLMARRRAAGGAGTGPPTLRTTILPHGGSLGITILPPQAGLLGPLPGRISVVSVFSRRSEQGPLGLDTSTFCLRIVTSESG